MDAVGVEGLCRSREVVRPARLTSKRSCPQNKAGLGHFYSTSEPGPRSPLLPHVSSGLVCAPHPSAGQERVKGAFPKVGAGWKKGGRQSRKENRAGSRGAAFSRIAV